MNTEIREILDKLACYGLAGNLPLTKSNEAVNHPKHYQGEGLEAIDVIEAYNLSFSMGNAVKYILRAGKKGDASEDLLKAIWYLEREIERLKVTNA